MPRYATLADDACSEPELCASPITPTRPLTPRPGRTGRRLRERRGGMTPLESEQARLAPKYMRSLTHVDEEMAPSLLKHTLLAGLGLGSAGLGRSSDEFRKDAAPLLHHSEVLVAGKSERRRFRKAMAKASLIPEGAAPLSSPKVSIAAA